MVVALAVDRRGRAEVISLQLPELRRPIPRFQLVDVRSLDRFGTLEKLYSEIERLGALDEVLSYLTVFGGVKDLRIVQNRRDEAFVLHAKERESSQSALEARERGSSIPAYLLGDGFKKYLQILSAFVLTRGGLVLVEEPEAFQHPRSLRMLADVLVTLSAHTQFILSTHSLEFIDLILDAIEGPPRTASLHPAEARPTLGDLVLLRMHLEGGELSAVPVSGAQVRDLRHEPAEDLR